MKKLFGLVLCAIVMLSFSNVSAISENELRNKLTSTYIINGNEWRIDSRYIVEIERYLNEYDLSDNDMNYISEKIDEAIEIIRTSRSSSLNDLSKAKKNELKALVADISNNTSVKASFITVDGGKTAIRVVGPDGKVFQISEPIKYTNDNTYIYVSIASVILAIFTIIVVRKSTKVNA